jgi:hypothetical protein
MLTQPLPDPDWKEAARLTQQLQRSEVLRDVVSEAQDYGRALDIQVDRKVAGRLDVSMQTVERSDLAHEALGPSLRRSGGGPAHLVDLDIAHGHPDGLGRRDVPLSAIGRYQHTTAPLVVALRFRPIMMTTLAVLFGAIPLAFESGTGSELRNPLGITIIGGLLLSQLLTPNTTPVVYLAMERLKRRVSRPATLQPELALPDEPEPSQHPAE